MRNYSNWIETYLEYSSNSEAPESFHKWTAISVVAGALRRHVWIDMRYFQWTTNMYIIFVAPPGIVSKSTTAKIGMDLLRQVEGIKFGPDSVTWQALIGELQESKEMFNTLEDAETYHIMSALTCVCSEFGNFLNPHDREMVDALVSLWDGQIGVWTKLTKTQGNNLIENPWLNVLACTTPDWIAGNFPESLIGGGFTSRCLFIYADKKRHYQAYTDNAVAADFDEMQLKLIQDLSHIATNIIGEYKLSRAARVYGEVWYEKHYENPPAHLVGERFGGYIARKQTHIHKLAMVLAAVESDKLIIEEHHLFTASNWVESLEEFMPLVFKRIGTNVNQREVTALLRYVNQVGEVSNIALYAKVLDKFKYKDYQEAMDGAAGLGYIRRIDKAGKIYYGRGTVPFE